MADPMDREITFDEEALEAHVHLVARSGARSLEFGHLDDEQRDWWAHAQYRGARISVEHEPDPVAAVEALAVEILTGAKCVRCERLVALSDRGAFARPGVMADGSKWTIEQIRARVHEIGLCRWERRGRRWRAACEDGEAI